MTALQTLINTAAQDGLTFRGGFIAAAEDKVPELSANHRATALVLFGNAGSSIWESFSASQEHSDGQADPLNRWSQRIATTLAQQCAGKAIFPFGGPVHQPFLRWAQKAEQLYPSKIGLLIHPSYGLWHAYRFAIALPDCFAADIKRYASSQVKDAGHPCETCVSQACLSACPVQAFSDAGYDVKGCFKYLDQHPGSPCHQTGCQARTACPVGHDYRYQPEHAAFHMHHFVESLRPKKI